MSIIPDIVIEWIFFERNSLTTHVTGFSSNATTQSPFRAIRSHSNHFIVCASCNYFFLIYFFILCFSFFISLVISRRRHPGAFKRNYQPEDDACNSPGKKGNAFGFGIVNLTWSFCFVLSKLRNCGTFRPGRFVLHHFPRWKWNFSFDCSMDISVLPLAEVDLKVGDVAIKFDDDGDDFNSINKEYTMGKWRRFYFWQSKLFLFVALLKFS